ncbi:MAG: hypothetical protein JW883_06430 [Deltaproteobacteria bacterium]|nr:hypothetical protein [Deltaproteobacteria bacterium]
MTIVEYDLSDDLDFGPKVSVEIDGDLAKTLMTLAQDGVFGNDLSLTDLKTLVHHLLAKRAKAGKNKRDLILKASKEQMGQMDAEQEEAIQYFEKKRQPEDMLNNENNE